VALIGDWSRAEGDRPMIAARRDDVADLNQRARQLLPDRGELGPVQLTGAGRECALGDCVVSTRNDRRAGILNGQRGTLGTADDARQVAEVSSTTNAPSSSGASTSRPATSITATPTTCRGCTATRSTACFTARATTSTSAADPTARAQPGQSARARITAPGRA
jgi:hypothetical protein